MTHPQRQCRSCPSQAWNRSAKSGMADIVPSQSAGLAPARMPYASTVALQKVLLT